MLLNALVWSALMLASSFNTAASQEIPYFLQSSSTQARHLYQQIQESAPSAEQQLHWLSLSADLFKEPEALDLSAIIVATLVMQHAYVANPEAVDALYLYARQQLKHYPLKRNYLFSCMLSGRQKLDASIDAIRQSQGANQDFYHKLLNFDFRKSEQHLIDIAEAKYGVANITSLYHALLYAELSALSMRQPQTVALLLRNIALAHNQNRNKSMERVVSLVIRELEIEGKIPVMSTPASIYAYLL